MDNSISATAPFPISARAAWLAMGASITYQALLIALIFIRPDLDPSWHTISEWAIGPHGWIMSVAFFVSSISYLSLFVMLKPQLWNRMGRIGLGALLICAIGVAGVGICTTDPMPLRPPLSVRGTLHVVCGTTQLVLFPVSALLIGLSLARANDRWRKGRRLSLWSAWVPLFGFLSFAVYTAVFVSPKGPQAYGPGVNIGWPPRFAFFTYAVWIVVVTSQAIRYSRSSFAHGQNNERERSGAFDANALSRRS